MIAKKKEKRNQFFNPFLPILIELMRNKEQAAHQINMTVKKIFCSKHLKGTLTKSSLGAPHLILPPARYSPKKLIFFLLFKFLHDFDLLSIF